MKENLHPTWYPEAAVSCMSCGKSWTTGATVPSLTTEICSNCHPFYTGEQRIIDTEGRVDTFLRRLQKRDDIRAKQEQARAAAKPNLELPLSELGLSQRHLTTLEEKGIVTVQNFLDKINESGDEGILTAGIGRQALAEIKKSLRNKGFTVGAKAEEAAE
jgi:large subunit ribosomal protein L31